MLFKPEHVEMIRSGRKIQTRRVWKRPMVKVGGIYKVKTKMLSKEYHCLIEVTGLRQETLCQIEHKDAMKEGYGSIPEYMDVWERINGSGSWQPDLEVYVIDFRPVTEAWAKFCKDVKETEKKRRQHEAMLEET